MAFQDIFKNIFVDISIILRRNTDNHISGEINESGDEVKNIDLLCENVFVDHLKDNKLNILGYISEETKNLTLFKDYDIDTTKKTFIVAFDPLDGSSNYSCNINTGSIYGVYEYCRIKNKLLNIVDAGYCLYGIKSIMGYTSNNELFMRDILNNNNIPQKIHFNLIKNKQKIYSINQSYDYNPEIKYLIQQYRKENYSMRWVGTLVADAHRILLNDGIFYYPETNKNSSGKIRTLYEGIPFAYIFEKGGGIGLNSSFKNILDRIPDYDLDKPHVCCCIVLASNDEYTNMVNHLEMYEEFKY
jgi:fructose-1,6-bisphosphatase I